MIIKIAFELNPCRISNKIFLKSYSYTYGYT